MITDVKLDDFGREVPRKKVPMNTIERAVDLQPFSVSSAHNCTERTTEGMYQKLNAQALKLQLLRSCMTEDFRAGWPLAYGK